MSIISEIYREIFIDLGLTIVGDDAIKNAIKTNTIQTIQEMDSLRTKYTSAGMERLPINEMLQKWTT